VCRESQSRRNAPLPKRIFLSGARDHHFFPVKTFRPGCLKRHHRLGLEIRAQPRSLRSGRPLDAQLPRRAGATGRFSLQPSGCAGRSDARLLFFCAVDRLVAHDHVRVPPLCPVDHPQYLLVQEGYSLRPVIRGLSPATPFTVKPFPVTLLPVFPCSLPTVGRLSWYLPAGRQGAGD